MWSSVNSYTHSKACIQYMFCTLLSGQIFLYIADIVKAALIKIF